MKGVDLKTCTFTNLAFFANFPIAQNGKFSRMFSPLIVPIESKLINFLLPCLIVILGHL
jgi:hypothetical protein